MRRVGVFLVVLTLSLSNIGRAADSGERLRDAARRGETEEVKQLLDSEVEINGRDRAGRTALWLAALKGRSEIVDTLLGAGADPNVPNADGVSPIAGALKKHETEVVLALAAAGANCGPTDGGLMHDVAQLAVEGRNADALEALLRAGLSPDLVGPDDVTLLTAASLKGDLKTAQVLISAGAQIELASEYRKQILAEQETLATSLSLRTETVSFQGTPLLAAVFSGNLELVSFLLGHGADPRALDSLGSSALVWAIVRENTRLAELLLDAGADLEVPATFALRLNPMKDGLSIVGGSTGVAGSSLLAAAHYGRLELVRLLLDRGAEIDALDDIGRTPLMHAAASGHVDIVAELLRRGASLDVLAPSFPVWTRPFGGLLFQELSEDEESPSLLLEQGLAPFKVTPLAAAAAGGQLATVELLLRSGAQVDFRGAEGITPLMLAAYGGYEEVVRLLLSSGADVEIADENMDGALEWSGEKGHSKIFELLARSGAPLRLDEKGVLYIYRTQLMGWANRPLIVVNDTTLGPLKVTTCLSYSMLPGKATVSLISRLPSGGGTKLELDIQAGQKHYVRGGIGSFLGSGPTLELVNEETGAREVGSCKN